MPTHALSQLTRDLAEGRRRALDVVDSALQSALWQQPRYNAFLRIYQQEARQNAAGLDLWRGRRGPVGPLHGVPVAVKDNIDEGGVLCTAGSRAYGDRTPGQDAAVVRALREAGAVIVGRTNMHELADGATSENPHYGAVQNPWRPGSHPGGSSGGSAVAVLVGAATVALGTDTGGSVRVPAALCGIVGFKPTSGLLSTRGVVPLSTTLDHVGPMGRSVCDVATFLRALSPHAPDPRVVCAPRGGWRIGVLEGFAEEAEAGVGARFSEALRALERRGCVLVRRRVPRLARSLSLLGRIYGPEAARTHDRVLTQHPELLGADVRADLLRGARTSPERRAVALRDRRLLAAEIAEIMADLHGLISPTTPAPAAAHGTPASHRYLYFTSPFNLSGQPALSVPMGAVGGLPVGLQVIGARGRDGLVLGLGALAERALGGGASRPPWSVGVVETVP